MWKKMFLTLWMIGLMFILSAPIAIADTASQCWNLEKKAVGGVTDLTLSKGQTYIQKYKVIVYGTGCLPTDYIQAFEVDHIPYWGSLDGWIGNIWGTDTLPWGGVGKVIKYDMLIGPYEYCGEYTFVNTAKICNDKTDSYTIKIHVPCEGCTLTPGYWKTHSRFGKAPYDSTWANIGEETPFFDTGSFWYQVLMTPPKKGNAYYILAHAYIAAYLNQLKGAEFPEAVVLAMTDSAALLDQYDINMSGITGAVRDRFVALADLLDQYNNGYIGPGHCSEE